MSMSELTGVTEPLLHWAVDGTVPRADRCSRKIDAYNAATTIRLMLDLRKETLTKIVASQPPTFTVMLYWC